MPALVPSHALVLALLVCAVAAILEGIAAGRGVRQRFGELSMPQFSPPLRAWVVIGVAYYVVCFTVLYRLLLLSGAGLRTVGLILILLILLANAVWNYLFFRRRSLRLSFGVSVPYSAVAVVLLAILFKLDRIAALALL